MISIRVMVRFVVGSKARARARVMLEIMIYLLLGLCFC
jgi:hypothetical protein